MLNFIPLLIWMIAFPLSTELADHWRQRDGRSAYNESANSVIAGFYIFGCVLWLVIGAVLQCSQ